MSPCKLPVSVRESFKTGGREIKEERSKYQKCRIINSRRVRNKVEAGIGKSPEINEGPHLNAGNIQNNHKLIEIANRIRAKYLS